jgi:hypothetical protein
MAARALHSHRAALIGALLCAGCGRGAARELEWPDERVEPTIAVRSWDRRALQQARRSGETADENALAQFPSETLRITARAIDASGIPRAHVLVSELGGHYELTIDQLNYRTDTHADGASTAVAVESGFGVRLRARVKAFQGGIDLANLTAIARAADVGGLAGALTFETIGLDGSALDSLVPEARALTAESLRDAMKAASSLRALLEAGDPSLRVAAQELRRRPLEPRGSATSRL